MRDHDPMTEKLIAPCGMNCRLCMAYTREKNPCDGCRGPDERKPKSCLKCAIVLCEKNRDDADGLCTKCDKHCQRLKYLDKRYRERYHMSMVENLQFINEHGMAAFLADQDRRFRCSDCGMIICVHHESCDCCGATWLRESEATE